MAISDLSAARERASRLFIASPHSPIVSGYLEGVREERERCDKIVCEEWHRAVTQFGLLPGSHVEQFMGAVITRIRELKSFSQE